jgi:hypothetical protein
MNLDSGFHRKAGFVHRPASRPGGERGKDELLLIRRGEQGKRAAASNTGVLPSASIIHSQAEPG